MNSHEDSLLRDLVRLIPGYGAYQDQETRREDDRLTREFLEQRLAECKDKLDKIGLRAVEHGQLREVAKIDGVREQLDLAQRRLAAAVEGYAGWFSSRRVDAKLLETIATMDASMVSLVDQIDLLARKKLERNEIGFEELNELVALLHARIERRNATLKSGS